MDIIKILIKIVLYAIAAYWMYQDAKNRDTSGWLWVIAAILLCWKGLFYWSAWVLFPLFIILYLIARPKGELIYCTECFKKKLLDKPYCPHCFHIDEAVLEEEFDDNELNEQEQDNSSDTEEDSNDDSNSKNTEGEDTDTENKDNNDGSDKAQKESDSSDKNDKNSKDK